MPTESFYPPQSPTELNADSTILTNASASRFENSVSRLPQPSSHINLRPRPTDDGLPEIDNADSLITDATLQTPAEIVRGVLHKGTKGVIASCSKAGKTWLLLDLAISVSTGMDFLAWNTTQGKVLFVNFEIPKPFMKERIRHLKQKKEIDRLENLDIWTLRGHTADFDALMAKVIARIRTREYVLVVLDPIYKAMVGRDENSAQTVGSLCQKIEEVAVQTGAAVVYSHHFSKGNQANKSSMDRMSGSGVFARDSDTILVMTPHTQEDCYTVDLTLRNFPAHPPIVVEFDFPVMEVRTDLHPDDLRGKGGRPAGDYAEILMALLDAEPLRATEWQKVASEEAGIDRATFYKEKKKLVNAGMVMADERTKKWRRVQEMTVNSDSTPKPNNNGVKT